ncbi:MAG TPA: YceI family protein [Acidimicrobiales bacterium]|nr:YceI family protein [Acidimicrobiales bacterium]
MTTTTATATLTRQRKGTVVPVPGVYDIDAKHTSVEFVVRHLMISKVRGRFDDVEGTITVADVPEDSSVAVTIGAASVRTGEDQRDAHLRSPDFFDVDTHPRWSFTSTAVAQAGDHWKVTGDLTISAVSRPVVLDVEFEGANVTPWGTSALGFSATTEIDREDWGLTYNQVLETGGVMVGKKVRIELNVEAVARPQEDATA